MGLNRSLWRLIIAICVSLNILFLLFPSSVPVHIVFLSTFDLINIRPVCIMTCHKTPLLTNLSRFEQGYFYSLDLLRVRQLRQEWRPYFYCHVKRQFDITKLSHSPSLNNVKHATHHLGHSEGHLTYSITITCETPNFSFLLFVSLYTLLLKPMDHTKNMA